MLEKGNEQQELKKTVEEIEEKLKIDRENNISIIKSELKEVQSEIKKN